MAPTTAAASAPAQLSAHSCTSWTDNCDYKYHISAKLEHRKQDRLRGAELFKWLMRKQKPARNESFKWQRKIFIYLPKFIN